MVCLPSTGLNCVLSISIMLLLGGSAMPQAHAHVWPNPIQFVFPDVDGYPHAYYGSPLSNGQAIGPPNPPEIYISGLDPDGQLVFVLSNWDAFAYCTTVTATMTSVTLSAPIPSEPWVWGAPPGSGEANWTLDYGPYSISYSYTPYSYPAADPVTGMLPIGGTFWVARFKVTDCLANLSGWQNRVAEGSHGHAYTAYRWVDGPPVHFWVSRQEESFPYTITGVAVFAFNQPLRMKAPDRLLAACRRDTFLHDDRRPFYGMLLA